MPTAPTLAAVAEAADTVDPAERVTVLADEPDNRVLEAAAAGLRYVPEHGIGAQTQRQSPDG
jgi:hypothetical protein